MTTPIVTAEHLTLEYRRRVGGSGLLSAAKGLFRSEYKTHRAVDDVSFRVNPGEFLGYLGPNGAGKSTTIRMLAGILWPTSGRALIGNVEACRNQRLTSQRIGVVFGHKTQMMWDLPARETFRMLRYMYGIPAGIYTERISELDSVLEFRSYWDQPVRQLSLGQRVRCDVAASMLHQPDVVFLDEPTVGMDIFAKDRLRILLQDRVARHGLTVFLTTHDIVEVQRLCGRLILLDAGHVLYEGAPGELASMLGVSRALRLSSDQPVQNASLPDAQLMRADENEAVFWISAGAREADVMARALVLFPGASVTVEDIDLESLVRTLYLRRRTKDPERVQGEGKSVQA